MAQLQTLLSFAAPGADQSGRSTKREGGGGAAAAGSMSRGCRRDAAALAMAAAAREAVAGRIRTHGVHDLRGSRAPCNGSGMEQLQVTAGHCRLGIVASRHAPAESTKFAVAVGCSVAVR